MKKLFILILTMISLTFIGCSNKYKTTDNLQMLTKLERSKIVYISISKDGVYGSEIYRDSGKKVTNALQTVLTSNVSSIIVAAKVESQKEALQNAKTSGARYLFYPAIIHWEQRRAAWSGIPSRLGISITVFDLAKEDEDSMLMQKQLDVRGKIFTFKSQYVEELLPPTLQQFVSDIF
ncbi:MAG: DUF4823 domain-containing protein [Desulfovibrio sp.]|nr:DUF4823 domain-containing protein [Desulfovibrio sp.]